VDPVEVGLRDVQVRALAAAGAKGLHFDDLPQGLDLVAVNRVGTDADLEPVEVGRVVASRDHDASSRLQVPDGEVQDRRGAGSDVDDVDTRGEETFLQAGRKGGGAEAAVPAEGHRPDPPIRGVGADGAAELHDEVWLQVLFDQPPDVIFPEDGAVHDHLRTRDNVYHRLGIQTITAAGYGAEKPLGRNAVR